MQPSNQAIMEQHQYYYASLPNNGSQPSTMYAQYQQPQPGAPYYPEQYVMTSSGQAVQPMMIGQPQASYIYMSQPAVPAQSAAGYANQQYYPTANTQAVYYSPEMMQPVYFAAQPSTSPMMAPMNVAAQALPVVHQETQGSSSVRPLSTSTPLPPEISGCPPPMTNQLPYMGNVRSAYMSYHRSVEHDHDDVLAEISKISIDYTDDTMCDSNERPLESTHQAMPVSNSNMHYRRREPMVMPSNYKTRLCMTYAAGKTCEMGQRCKFAHGTHELRGVDVARPPNMKFKTRLCKNYIAATTNGSEPFCPYGLRCEFIHPTDREFALLPIHIRKSIDPAVLAVTNQSENDVTPDGGALGEYQHPPTVTRSAVKPAPEKILLKNRKVAGSMMCLASGPRREHSDDSAIGSGSSESGGSANCGKPCPGRPVPSMQSNKFHRRRSMSQINLKRWNSSEGVGGVPNGGKGPLPLQQQHRN